MGYFKGRALRHFLLCMAAACMAATVHGQAMVGFRGGVNWAKINSRDGLLGTPSTRLGPTGALVFGVPLSKVLTLAPEVGFTQRGYGAEAQPFGFFSGQKLALDYADLGLLLRVHMAEGPPARPYVLAGATWGYLVGARMFQFNPWTNAFQGTVLDPGDVRTSPWSSGYMNRWNVDLCAGLGFIFTAGRLQVFVEGRYQYGLTNIWNDVPVADVNGSPVGVLQAYDRSISVSLGWLIPLGADAGKGGEAPSE